MVFAGSLVVVGVVVGVAAMALVGPLVTEVLFVLLFFVVACGPQRFSPGSLDSRDFRAYCRAFCASNE